jgi:hypothetical protein
MDDLNWNVRICSNRFLEGFMGELASSGRPIDSISYHIYRQKIPSSLHNRTFIRRRSSRFYVRFLVVPRIHPILKENPPPAISSSPPANNPFRSPASSLGASPLLGAGGVSLLLRFSWFALLGNVGNISFAFERGSSAKYLCFNVSVAVGRDDGL